MKKVFLLILIAIVGISKTFSQTDTRRDSTYFIKLNQQIDNYVVEQNLKALDTLYAEDFVFSHGTGFIEGKNSWLATVRRTKYPQRKHDSLMVEIHADIAILKGKLDIVRIDDENKTARYQLKYIRVYAVRGKIWQLTSHITIEEHDEK